MKSLRIGYIPLIDAAIPIIAAEGGFAEREGIHIELIREVSWSNIRDRLILDMFDAAHILAPLAVATSLGFGHIKVPLIAPFVLNANGNCITLAAPIWRALAELLGHEPADALESARAMGALIARRKQQALPPLTFGVVFPYSVHAFLIRHWLRQGGVDTMKDVQFVVVPPPYMMNSLSNGLIDGYCVGEPWNSRAVEAGMGCIAAFGAEITAQGPDKVLGFRAAWAQDNPETLEKLLRAMKSAAEWCADADNHGTLAGLLAQSQYLNVAPRTILNALSGRLAVTPTRMRSHPNFLNLGQGAVNRPDPRQGLWIYAELMHVLGSSFDAEQAQAARGVYRPDLFEAAAGILPQAKPQDAVGLAYGPAFDDQDIQAYLRSIGNVPV